MGNSDVATPSKPDKASSPVQEQLTMHPYPNWAALQAYYGPGASMPPPYFTTAVASGQAPHPYMWGPQPLMPSYGTPYAAIYPRGVFSHVSVPLGPHSHCQGIVPYPGTSEAVVMATPLSVATPAKSSRRKVRGLLKRLKRLDGHDVSTGNGSADDTSGSAVQGSSQSGECSAEGSSDGNNESGGNKIKRRSAEDTLISGKDGEAVALDNSVHGEETNASNIAQKTVGTLSSSIPKPEMEGLANGELKFSAAPVPPATSAMVPGGDGVPIGLWTQDEMELKRERRKQSNRESARRSRLRKQVNLSKPSPEQAESEELALKAETLNAENMTLRSEISRLKDNSEKVRLENSALKEKLKSAQLSQAHEIETSPDKIEPQGSPSVCTENLLSRINNSSLCNSSGNWENEVNENSTSKLCQLLDSSPRTDAVAAS